MQRLSDVNMAQLGTLKPREFRFVGEYLVDENGRQAAIRAGYPPRSAATTACDLLKREDVQTAIAERRAFSAERDALALGVNRDRIVLELARIAFTDVREVIRWSTKAGTLRLSVTDADQLSPGAAALIKSVRPLPDGRVEIQLRDKEPALKLLSQVLGLIKDGDQPPAGGISHESALALVQAALQGKAQASIPQAAPVTVDAAYTVLEQGISQRR